MNERRTFTGLYFGVLPDLNDLVGCLIEEENDEEMNTIQPLGCREFLFTEPRVLISPCLENGKQAFLVCKETVLQCNKFKALMSKLKFKVVRRVDVNKELFQYCLSFTLTQKLAPLWNKVGEYFVQGRDFLDSASKLNAVSFDVNITDRLCIGLKAFNIKQHISRADQFCSSSNILQHFLLQRNFTIQQDSIQDELCYVLPSLKKARVVGISHEIPPDSPFSSYEDLRKHWKLMYGYRLPPNESAFYNVRFFGSKIFTYPGSCIHSNYPHISPRCDQQAIFQEFLQDIQSRIPFICESPLRLTSSALYSSKKLHNALNDNQSSLTRSVPPQFKHCTPFVYSQTNQPQNKASPSLNQNTNIHISNHSRMKQTQDTLRSTCQNSNALVHKTTDASVQNQVPLSSANETTSIKKNASTANDDISMQNKASFSCLSSTTSQGIVVSSATVTRPNGPRIIPTFTKRLHASQKPVGRQRKEASTPKVCPIFKSKSTPSRASQETVVPSKDVHDTASITATGAGLSSMKRDVQQHTAVERNRTHSINVTSQSRVVTPAATNTVHKKHDIPGQGSQNVCSPVPRQIHQNHAPVQRNGTLSHVTSHTKKLPDVRPGLSLARSALNHRPSLPGNPTERPNKDRELSARSMNMVMNQGAQFNRCITPKPLGSPGLSIIQNYRTESTPSIFRNTPPLQKKVISNASNAFLTASMNRDVIKPGTPGKRQISTADGDTVQVKKPRSKPKVQDDVDVRKLALNNQLNKVNTITLIDWLKKHNVPVKQKDKKGELMEKVMSVIKTNVHES